MAHIVVVGNQTYKKRNVVAVWLGLPFITLGIYSYVWIYKVNDEARRFLGDNSIRPALSVLAFIPGFLLIVPPFVAIYRTGVRIARMEAAAGSPNRTEPVVGLALGFVFGLYSLYYQDHLNGLWDRYLWSGNVPPPAWPPPPPPSPPFR
ncbi:MAG: DUF4234 domain-containing protein [Candidatus Dormibacteria bacterium]